MTALNLFSGLAQGFAQGQSDRLNREQGEELKKLQVKMFKRKMEMDEQAQAAKKQLMDLLAPSFPTMEEPKDYVSAMPQAAPQSKSLREVLGSPQGQALALQSGLSLKDLKDYQQPDITEILASLQTGGALNPGGGGGGIPESPFVPQTGGGLQLSGIKFDTTGRPMLDFANQFDPYKQAQAAREAAKLYNETGLGKGGAGGGDGMTPKARAELSAKLEEQRPKAKLAVANALSGFDRMEKSVQALMNDPALPLSTGALSITGKVPGTPMKDFQARLTTLKSQIAFTVLQSIRDASQTGGAVGQVSNFEQQLLMNNLAALDEAQSPEAFKNAMGNILEYLNGARDRMANAYRDTYGESIKGQASTAPNPGKQADPLGIR